MMANEVSQSLSLKVLVEKEKNRFIFAESNNDFVDVLFSFMTMPIGTIVRLAREHSIEVDFGCFNNLFESVENLDKEHRMWCKDTLLRPRSAAETYWTTLKLNFIDSDTIEFYTCNNRHRFSPYSNAQCHCGKPMSYVWKPNNSISVHEDGGVFVKPTARFLITDDFYVKPSVHEDGGVFVKPTARFLITDDFYVKPISTVTGFTLLSKFGAMDRSTREERTISIERDKVMKLLMSSLTTRTPFSETILESVIDKNNFDICRKNYGPGSTDQSQRATNTTKEETKIFLKLIINKSNNRALYVEAKEDFVDLIASFLTFPLGYVFKEFPCLSLRGCLGNLYKSIQDFDVGEFLVSEEMKAILVNPKLAPGFALAKQLIPIEEVPLSSYSLVRAFSVPPCKGKEIIIDKGFIKGPTMFMVTDDLTITPLSLFSSMSLLDRLNIPLSDILEQEVTIGEEEALRLLEAALVSKTALTDVFIPKEWKQNLYEDSGS